MGSRVLILVIVWVLATFSYAAEAQTNSARTIVILYDSQIEKTPADSLARMFIEGSLNALGLAVRYADVNQTDLLNRALGDQVRALVSAFPAGSAVKNPARLIDLYQRALDSNKQIIIFGEPGFFVDQAGKATSMKVIAPFLKRFGLEYSGEFATNAIDYQPIVADAQFSIPHTQPSSSFAQVPVFKLISPESKLIMRGKSRDQLDIPLVFANQSGLISLGDSAFSLFMASPQSPQLRQWILNPLKLFILALQLEDTPRFDTTTLFGARSVIALVDGSGWTQVSTVEKYYTPPSASIEVLEREFLMHARSALFTVAPVMAEFDAAADRSTLYKDLGQLFRKPLLMPATSGYSNLYQWPEESNNFKAKQEYAGYIPEPRHEIGEALTQIKTLLPNDTREPCYVASDTAYISPAAARYVEQHNLCSIVGGSTRLDPLHPNIAWLQPISYPISVSDDAQRRHPVLFPMDSERNYILDKGNPQYGYRFVSETIKQTDAPYRLAPIGLRFGLRAGASPTRLASIKKVIEELPPMLYPLTVAAYADMVRDFQNARIERCGSNCWQAKNRGTLQTLRINARADRAIDLMHSSGVLGARQINDELFIALDPEIAAPHITLSDVRTSDQAASLVESSWEVRGLKRTEDSFTFQAVGSLPGKMTWKLPWKEPARVSLTRLTGEFDGNRSSYAIDKGMLTIKLYAGKPNTKVQIKVKRSEIK